ncbi:Mu transposase C-terminal domain-containing protein [Salinicola sp. V024]|uniref:Mu transposase C-terminal domain-containing protein n=1 Tax=Salinicola sp. V024 TaxID=3459609 RepID=UPI004045185D
MKVTVNDVLEPVNNNSPLEKLARVLFVDPPRDRVHLIGLDGTPRRPFSVGSEDLKNSLAVGDTKHTTVLTPEYILVLEDSLSENQKLDRDNKWKIIAPLVESQYPKEIFYAGQMGKMVSERATELGIQRKDIYRLLYRFWMNGQLKNALLKNYTNTGKTIRTYTQSKPPGRKPKYQGVEIKRSKSLNAVDIKCIQLGYALYADDKVSKKSYAYHEMLAKFYTEKEIGKSPESRSRLLPSDQIPSMRQFIYWGAKAYDAVRTERGRMGERKWLKDRRPLSGTVRDGLRGPCHQFEIDATIGDIYLTNSYSRHMLIGRPVVYVVIDSFSGMIVGLYVGLEGPSWNGARQALFNTFTPKSEFCALYDVALSSGEWDCQHLPHEIYADRGEMLSEAAEGLAKGLKIDLGTAPPYRPDWKAMVESRFRVLNNIMGIRWLPGGVAARARERGERDYRLDATLNLKEFTKIIIKSVIQYNHFNRQPDRLTKHMVDDDVEPTPVGIWNWALQSGIIDHNNQPEELIYLHLLPRDRAVIRKNGIFFRGMHYTCDFAIQRNWFAKSRSRGVSSVECWYDPNSAQHIWIQGENKKFERCDLRFADTNYAGHRSDEIYDFIQAQRQTPPDHKRSELEGIVSLQQEIKDIVDTANREKSDELAPVTKSGKLKDIRKNRAVERELIRETSYVPEGGRSQ